MTEKITVQQDANPKLKELVRQINDRFDAIEERLDISPDALQQGDRVEVGTVRRSDRALPSFTYYSPTVNIYSFLDPLYQALAANSVATRESRVEMDSIGNENLQANSVRARNIVAGSITTELLAADSVTADKISVSQLSAIVANLGTITAGNITLDSSGFIRGGATAYNSGTGFWMGYDTSAYKFFIGDSVGNKITWDGSTLSITGTITATTGTIGGFSIGSDYIRDSANTMGLASTVTGGDDVRFWAGDTYANRASAPFRVTESGVFVASSATITGAITATSGTIGGFTISSTTLSAGSGSSKVTIDSTYGIICGAADGSHNFTGLTAAEIRLIGYSPDYFTLIDAGDLVLGTWTYSGSYNYSITIELNGSSGTITCETIKGSTNYVDFEHYVRVPGGGSGRFSFGNNYLYEEYGINLNSEGTTWPVRIVGGALMMNGSTDKGSSYFTAGYIYWSSSVYLYESGGYLNLADAGGDRPIT